MLFVQNLVSWKWSIRISLSSTTLHPKIQGLLSSFQCLFELTNQNVSKSKRSTWRINCTNVETEEVKDHTHLFSTHHKYLRQRVQRNQVFIGWKAFVQTIPQVLEPGGESSRRQWRQSAPWEHWISADETRWVSSDIAKDSSTRDSILVAPISIGQEIKFLSKRGNQLKGLFHWCAWLSWFIVRTDCIPSIDFSSLWLICTLCVERKSHSPVWVLLSTLSACSDLPRELLATYWNQRKFHWQIQVLSRAQANGKQIWNSRWKITIHVNLCMLQWWKNGQESWGIVHNWSNFEQCKDVKDLCWRWLTITLSSWRQIGTSKRSTRSRHDSIGKIRVPSWI